MQGKRVRDAMGFLTDLGDKRRLKEQNQLTASGWNVGGRRLFR